MREPAGWLAARTLEGQRAGVKGLRRQVNIASTGQEEDKTRLDWIAVGAYK
jgi:hypothetical protein